MEKFNEGDVVKYLRNGKFYKVFEDLGGETVAADTGILGIKVFYRKDLSLLRPAKIFKPGDFVEWKDASGTSESFTVLVDKGASWSGVLLERADGSECVRERKYLTLLKAAEPVKAFKRGDLVSRKYDDGVTVPYKVLKDTGGGYVQLQDAGGNVVARKRKHLEPVKTPLSAIKVMTCDSMPFNSAFFMNTSALPPLAEMICKELKRREQAASESSKLINSVLGQAREARTAELTKQDPDNWSNDPRNPKNWPEIYKAYPKGKIIKYGDLYGKVVYDAGKRYNHVDFVFDGSTETSRKRKSELIFGDWVQEPYVVGAKFVSDFDLELIAIEKERKAQTAEKVVESPTVTKTEQADRYNTGKLDWSLVDFEALQPMVRVLMKGAEKYSPDNWKRGLPMKDMFSSLMRHMVAFMSGQDNDAETGESHLGHALCNLMFMSWMLANKPEFDNRKEKK